ncbi:helix-turn-helix domain-containing protein [Oceanibacterium hippocampi]|uniref:OmpR/PhoB-type domain-containing protein n=1 Tax=Oceanibacterium hippocampi TaxID=745714 RepID=A0A1Y5SWX6_9PROT|nr:helix-turn-helix domain-containing protein [Oceanibacterium hippocampi]SLN50387.1 hypothetical protein OCH7691_02221 [Oceanibacterium hippocampi]
MTGALTESELMTIGRVLNVCGLSPVEMRIVNALLCHPYPLGRRELMRIIHAGEAAGGAVDDGTIYVHVWRIRQKTAWAGIRLICEYTRGYALDYRAGRSGWLKTA